MPKIVDHDERRRHFVDATIALVVREGFENVTVRQIAAEAGYTHGAILRYFPSKQSLLTEAVLQQYGKMDARIAEETTGRRGLDALERICREILPFGEFGPLHARVVIAFWDHAAHSSEFGEIASRNIGRWRGLFRQFLTEAQEDGELVPGLDIEVAVNEISTRNLGWYMLSVILPSVAVDQNIDRALTALLEGFRAPRGAQGQ